MLRTRKPKPPGSRAVTIYNPNGGILFIIPR